MDDNLKENFKLLLSKRLNNTKIEKTSLNKPTDLNSKNDCKEIIKNKLDENSNSKLLEKLKEETTNKLNLNNEFKILNALNDKSDSEFERNFNKSSTILDKINQFNLRIKNNKNKSNGNSSVKLEEFKNVNKRNIANKFSNSATKVEDNNDIFNTNLKNNDNNVNSLNNENNKPIINFDSPDINTKISPSKSIESFDKLDINNNNNVFIIDKKISDNNLCEVDYFQGITDETIMIWESILINSNYALTCHLIHNDNDILNEELNETNQKVIKNDCDRTRVKDKHLLIDFRKNLELSLTHYCKVNKICYKQGLNEVFSPFLLLKSKLNISLCRVYNLFSCFVGRFLTNFYIEKDFYSLQSSLGLLNILLKYHNPMLYYLLEYAMITPEMYATSWLLTIFSSLNAVYSIYDLIIQENDEIFILFFFTAFLSLNMQLISEKDISQIPQSLSSLTLKTVDEVHKVYLLACDYRDKTPYSFRLYIRKLGIFSYKKHSEKKNASVEKLMTMPLMVSELIFLTHSETVLCPNSKCFYHKNKNLIRSELNSFDLTNTCKEISAIVKSQGSDEIIDCKPKKNNDNNTILDSEYKYLGISNNLYTHIIKDELTNNISVSNQINNQNDSDKHLNNTSNKNSNIDNQKSCTSKKKYCEYCIMVGNEKEPSKSIYYQFARLSPSFKNIQAEEILDPEIFNPYNSFDKNNINKSAYKTRKASNMNSKNNPLRIAFNEKKNINILILDIRMTENELLEDTKSCFLPMTISPSQEELLDENFAEHFSDRFIKEKDLYHIILLTNETEHFAEYEDQYYKEKISEFEKKFMQYQVQHRVSTVINKKLIDAENKKDAKLLIKIKEYDNLKKLIKCFLVKKFSSISYVYGGFKAVHEHCLKYNIPLLNHNKNCFLCNDIKQSLKKNILYESTSLTNKKKELNIEKFNKMNIELSKRNSIVSVKNIGNNENSLNKSMFMNILKKANPLNWLNIKLSDNIKSNNSYKNNSYDKLEENNSIIKNNENDSLLNNNVRKSSSANKLSIKNSTKKNNCVNLHLEEYNKLNSLVKNKSLLTVKEVNNIILLNNSYATFTGIIIDIRGDTNIKTISSINKNTQIFILISYLNSNVYFLNIHENKNINKTIIDKQILLSNELEYNANILFNIFEIIALDNILNIFTKKLNKNIVTINYKDSEDEFKDIIVDFILESDSKNFISTIKKSC